MATWTTGGEEQEDQEAYYEPSVWSGLWGFLWKAAIIIIAIALLIWAFKAVFKTSTTNCDICGATYKSGYTLRIQGGTSPLSDFIRFTGKALGDKPDGDAADEKVEANYYDLCPSCKTRVCETLDGMRGQGHAAGD